MLPLLLSASCMGFLYLCLLTSVFIACVLAMNVLAQLMMKNAAKSDLHCELQKSVNQQIFEH